MDGVTEEERKKALKDILQQLHAGVPPNKLKRGSSGFSRV
jgi:DUF438 domain-containing protein